MKLSVHCFIVCLSLIVSLIASANSYMWEDLVPPSSHDVIAFSNGQPPATGSIQHVEEARIREHLDKGQIFYSRNALADFLKEHNFHGVEIFDRESWGRGGAIATRERQVIYWSLMSDHVLHLQTEDVEHCYLLYIDEWTKQRVESLKSYQYPNQAGRKRYTPTLDEEIASYETALQSLEGNVQKYRESLGKLYAQYLAAAGDEQLTLANAIVSQRRLLLKFLKRKLEMEAKLAPLRLEAEFHTVEDRL